MGPPSAFVRGVRVAFMVGELVMDAMGGNPEDRTAFEREGAADGEDVLQPFGDAIAAMGEQAMVAHADADVGGEDPRGRWRR